MVHFNIFYTAVTGISRHKVRSAVVIACLTAILFPFVSAFSVLEGVREEAEISVEQGADMYLTMDMFGRNGMIPSYIAEEAEKLEGVVRAVPRIVSRVYVEGRLLVLLGLPAGRASSPAQFVHGSLPGEGEIVVGGSVAEKLRLQPGDDLSIGVRIFAIRDHIPYIQKKVYRVSGIFDDKASIWSSDLVLMDISDASMMFEMEDFVTDIAVYVKEGHNRDVAESLQKMNAFFRIQTKKIARTYMERGFNMKGGAFVVLYISAFAMAVPLLLVLSGFGLTERRKEIGILKATGWQTHEVLEMVFFESVVLSLIAANIAFILSIVWVRFFNAPLVAGIFINGMDSLPVIAVPASFSWMQLFMAVLFSVVLTLSGSVYSTWKAAVTPPAEAVR